MINNSNLIDLEKNMLSKLIDRQTTYYLSNAVAKDTTLLANSLHSCLLIKHQFTMFFAIFKIYKNCL